MVSSLVAIFNICDISFFDYESLSILSHIAFRHFFISSISPTFVHCFVEYCNQISTYGINGCRSMCVATSGRD